jgi:hypothetical protein
VPLDFRNALQNGYKVETNMRVPRLEKEGYVGFDILKPPRGMPRKVVAYDASGKAKVLDLQITDNPTKGFGPKNPFNGTNMKSEQEVLSAVKANPRSVSEPNWKALRDTQGRIIQKSARAEAEKLASSNSLHSSSGYLKDKGHLEIKYRDGSIKKYNGFKNDRGLNWTESGADAKAIAKEPDWSEVEVMNYVDEPISRPVVTRQIQNIEESLPEGLRKNDRAVGTQP